MPAHPVEARFRYPRGQRRVRRPSRRRVVKPPPQFTPKLVVEPLAGNGDSARIGWRGRKPTHADVGAAPHRRNRKFDSVGWADGPRGRPDDKCRIVRFDDLASHFVRMQWPPSDEVLRERTEQDPWFGCIEVVDPVCEDRQGSHIASLMRLATRHRHLCAAPLTCCRPALLVHLTSATARRTPRLNAPIAHAMVEPSALCAVKPSTSTMTLPTRQVPIAMARRCEPAAPPLFRDVNENLTLSKTARTNNPTVRTLFTIAGQRGLGYPTRLLSVGSDSRANRRCNR